MSENKPHNCNGSNGREGMESELLAAIEPKAGESIGGFFMRLGESMGWPTLAGPAARLGLTVGDLRWGPRQRKGSSARLCGQQLPLKVVDLDRRRVCPCCLEEDRYLREWWEINLFASCPIHGVALEVACRCGRQFRWDDVRLGVCSDCEGEVSPWSPRKVTVTALEMWLARRLGIIPSGATQIELSTDKLGFSLRLLENLGRFSAQGYTEFAPSPAATIDERNEYMALGLDALRDDRLEGIVQSSVANYRRISGLAATKRPLDGLGWFGDWFGDEELPLSHPIATRVTMALREGWGFPIADPHQGGAMHISVLAERLSKKWGELIPAAVAAEIERADAWSMPAAVMDDLNTPDNVDAST